MKIAVAQDLNEFFFIEKKLNDKDIHWLPLDLDVLLYCHNKKIKYIDPINIVGNKLQEDGILSLSKLEDEIKKINFKYEILTKEIFLLLRNYLSSIVFVYEVISKIKNLKSVYVSGWDIYEGPNVSKIKKKNYFVSSIVKSIFTEKNVIVLEKNNLNKNPDNTNIKYIYEFSKINLSNKKNILITNRFYNFKRIIMYFIKNKKIKCFLPFFPEDKKNFKDHILSFLGIQSIEFKKKTIQSNINISSTPFRKIQFKYKSLDLSNIINQRLNQLKPFLLDQELRSDAIKKMLEQFNFDLVVSNVVRKTSGMFIENSIKLKIKSFCISHGTISESYNKYDNIYKKIVLDSVININSDFIAAQSKITTKGLNNFNIKKEKVLETGNILFSENNKLFKSKRNKILYAVTNKNFFNIQFYGVEQYYEFFSNLVFLNSISDKNKLEILVQIHPNYHYLKNDLVHTFKNLTFSTDNIDNNLKKSYVTISFSSTTIEDSLFNKVPVILFDRWKRYLHFKPNKSNKKDVLYYINNKQDLVNKIYDLKKMKEHDFNQYIFQGKSNQNISNVFNKILKLEKNYA